MKTIDYWRAYIKNIDESKKNIHINELNETLSRMCIRKLNLSPNTMEKIELEKLSEFGEQHKYVMVDRSNSIQGFVLFRLEQGGLRISNLVIAPWNLQEGSPYVALGILGSLIRFTISAAIKERLYKIQINLNDYEKDFLEKFGFTYNEDEEFFEFDLFKRAFDFHLNNLKKVDFFMEENVLNWKVKG